MMERGKVVVLTQRKTVFGTLARPTILAVMLTIGMGFVSSSYADSIHFDLDPFTGDEAQVFVTVDDDTAGELNVLVEVMPEANTGNIGDITGIFFDLSKSIEESDITDGPPLPDSLHIGFKNSTNNLGDGVNLFGGGPDNPGRFDVGLQYAGFEVDDVQLIGFSIDLTGHPELGLDDFTRVAVRLQSVGPEDGDREGSSKLVSGDPRPGPRPSPMVPLPSAAWAGMSLLAVVGIVKFVLARANRVAV